jgi:hypothetical protein
LKTADRFGQRNVRRHRAERDRVVSDTEKFAVGGPVIGYQPGLRGDSAGHEGMYFLFAKALDPSQPSKPGLANADCIGVPRSSIRWGAFG